jgi:hypothetical protein
MEAALASRSLGVMYLQGVTFRTALFQETPNIAWQWPTKNFFLYRVRHARGTDFKRPDVCLAQNSVSDIVTPYYHPLALHKCMLEAYNYPIVDTMEESLY